MIDWKVGDKVVCVNNSNCNILKVDEIYTISDIYTNMCANNQVFIILKEISSPDGGGWYPSRFRPLIDKKKTTEFFEKLCIDATKKMELVE